MFKWIAENWLTLVLVIAICGIVAAVIASMVKKKKRGGSIGCGCGCASCPMSGACHNKQN